MKTNKMKVVIIGGVATGPKTAARLRRLNPEAEITIIERGKVLSYAGCGLPYFVGGDIPEAKGLTDTPAGVPRDSLMARTLFAVDELCGFLTACALVQPAKRIADVEVDSVKKKMKSKGFARSVNRGEIVQGAEELGVPLDEHVAFVRDAMKEIAAELGL